MDTSVTMTAAVILAGGKGERLGGTNKALLTIGGQRFIDRAIAVTEGCTPRLLAVGRAKFEAPPELTQVLDLETDYGGPLAGVAAAVEHLGATSSEALFSMAVDTPLFPADFLERALPLLKTSPVVIAAYAGQDYPTNALWRMDGLSTLPAALRAGTAPRSLRRLAEGLGAARLDYAVLARDDPFRNANTPEDLAYLHAAAARRQGG